MPLSWTQSRFAGKRIVALLAPISPLRSGVVAIIVLTVWFAWFRIVPSIRRDIVLLHDVHAVDERAIALEGDLQFEIQESRRRFLRVLLPGGTSAEAEQEVQSMREYDATIAITESRIAQLGAAPEETRQQFHDSWQRYIVQRDTLLATALAGHPADLRKADTDLGKNAFDSVEETVRNTAAALETSSGKHIRKVLDTLNVGLRELFGLIIFKTLALLLLVWIDLRRVSAEKRLEQTSGALRASEERFRQAYETASVGMGIIRLDGTVLSANPRAAEILGYTVDELIDMKVSDFMAPECVDDHRQKMANVPYQEEKNYRTERRVLRKDGTPVWVRNSVTLLQQEGQEPHFFSLTEEITHEHQANERLAYLANYDPVTNLPNRHFFEQQLRLSLQVAAGKPECVALIYLEIDSFDFLKGTFGPNVADDVLGELGNTLSAFRREGEVVARMDDHVFGMLMVAAPYDEATVARAGELRAVFHRASEEGKHRIPLSASIGISYSSDEVGVVRTALPDESKSASDCAADTLIKYARAAMLEARSRGGDSIFVADPSLQQRAAQRHQIESALLHGLREDEFRVVFQPQFQIATGKLVRFEALCRWTSAELGTIPPDRFIPIAEQTGLISEIGRRVLYDALRQAGKWVASGQKIGVAVNISPMQFMRPDFTHIITEALAVSNFPPALLELEITEGIFIRDLNLAVARIRELQRLGLSIALDDFGTGYSSLSYLQRMPIDAVKLDRSFVSDLTTDPATVSMVRSVLAMADALNLRVVTEGVETEEQLEILRELGCDEAQGYLLGRPESAEMALQRVLSKPMRPVITSV